jgi:superfamily II DNA helicase RecQ
MKGELPVRVMLPDASTGARRRPGARGKRTAEAPAIVDFDPELFERLRAVRLEIARDAGVPAYVVCHDRSLREMAALAPTNIDDLARVYGMGPTRIDLYGARFLAAIQSGDSKSEAG